MSANISFCVSVFWCGVILGICGDQLEFWERDPFEPRRFIDIKPIQKPSKSPYNNIKIIPKVVKKTNTTETFNNNASSLLSSFSLRSAAANKTNLPPKINTTKSTMDAKQALRMRKDASNKAWPRFQKTLRTKLVARSTRITPKPSFQEQAPYKTDEPIQMLDDKDRPESYLNPYNLKNQLEQIMTEYIDVNASVEVIGRTAEYNNIILIKAAETNTGSNKYFRADDSKYIDEVPEKKILFIVHGLSVKGIKKLPCMNELEQFKKLIDFYFAHLDKFDIFLMPMANPDGFSTHLDLWDKNMSPQNACPGVALDRNFDVMWNSSTTVSSCNQQYPGAKPFSEPETKAIREVFHRYSHKIIGYFHVHPGTYDYGTFKGDAVLYPTGYSDKQTDDDKYIDLRGEIDEAMKNASFQVISVNVDTIYSWYGQVLGTSVDYASTVYGVPYAMEFVMQPYIDYTHGDDTRLSQIALTEIWKRIIDVVFNNIHRNLKPNNEV